MMFMPEPQPSGAFEWTQAADGRALQCRPLLAYAPHLFTTRDLELRNPLDPLNPDTEWRQVAAAVGANAARLRLVRQVHGIRVAVSRTGDDSPWILPEADIIISDDPAAAIGVRVADCAAVLLADSRLGVVAAAHAGWRGTVQGVAPVAVAALRETFGSKPGDLIAAIGPSLGPCCGEVGLEVVEAFKSAGHAMSDVDRWFRAGASERPYLDLWRANADQLAAAGVPTDQIHSAALCTKSYPRLFHSYRADGPAAGRMVGVIRVKTDD